MKKLDSVNPEKTSGTFSANRRYKDSLFSDLFYADINAKDNLVQLYNSLKPVDAHSFVMPPKKKVS